MARVQYNINDLLKDIENAPNGIGEDLTYTNIYDDIKQARFEEDSNLSQGAWEHELKIPNWELVEQLSVEAIQNKSKDLQIVGWLVESLVILDNFEGISTSINILNEFIKKYWDNCYPLSDVLKTIFIKNNRSSQRINPNRFDSIDLIMQYICNLEYGIECDIGEYNSYHTSSWVDSKSSDKLLLPLINFFFKNIQEGTELINTLENINVNNVTENIMQEYLTQINYDKYKNNMLEILDIEYDPDAKKSTRTTFKWIAIRRF